MSKKIGIHWRMYPPHFVFDSGVYEMDSSLQLMNLLFTHPYRMGLRHIKVHKRGVCWMVAKVDLLTVDPQPCRNIHRGRLGDDEYVDLLAGEVWEMAGLVEAQ